MKCPYCNGDAGFDNSNLSHKYRHSCRNYFKLCPICNTIYATENNYHLRNCIVVENIFNVDFCRQCNRAWLPDFPTSWTRSFTNLNKIYEFIQDIYINEQKSINADNIYKIQRSHFGVIFNTERAKIRGVEEYIAGAGRRRMLEYFNVLKNMGILKIKENDKTLNHEFTRFGEELSSSSNPKALLSYFIIAYLNIKINNGYQRKQRNSCYRYFKIRFTHNLLRVINHLNCRGEGASRYQIGLAFLTRNEEQFKEYCLEYIDNYSSKVIKSLFFKDETELNRAVTSTFINVFQSMGIITSKDGLFFLTEFGLELLNYIELRPSIWFEDISRFAEKNGMDENEVFAKLLMWRLIKNQLIHRNTTNISMKELNLLVENILGISIKEIKDIHINLYYDEPMYKKRFSHSMNILLYLKKYLDNSLNISIREIKELCALLPLVWYNDIYSLVEKYEDIALSGFVNSADNKFKANLQSGKQWHEKSKQLFNEIGLLTVDYKSKPYFQNIIIERLKLMLPGGTIHNPDLLILEKNFGPRNCILVDAKDQHSINSEIPKLMGYNLYSKDKRVDTYTIIALRGVLPSSTKQRIQSSLEDFNRISIVEENALEKLVRKKMSKKDILEIILPKKGFKHITDKDIL